MLMVMGPTVMVIGKDIIVSCSYDKLTGFLYSFFCCEKEGTCCVCYVAHSSMYVDEHSSIF